MRTLSLTLLALSLPAFAGQGDPEKTHLVPPKVATDSQHRHNNYFPSPEILDLQTFAYATKERPAGLSYDAYSAVGYGLATSMMVVGPETDAAGSRRVIIIDAMEDMGGAKEVATDLLALYNKKYGTSLTKLPIDAIIYTHNHIDHTGGILGYLDMADKQACDAADPSIRGGGGDYQARRECVEILAQEKVTDAVINTATVSGRIIQARSLYMYGMLLANEQNPPPQSLPIGQAVTNGIGPYLTRGMSSYRIPSKTFSQELHVSAAGLNMALIYTPSETDDELVVYLPDAVNMANATSTGANWGGSGLLFSAEVIQGPAFPNLYSLRGTQYRSPATWYQSVDTLRSLDAWCMVPSHGPPVCQRANIDLLLTNFRDAVQYVHDQTVRYMNQGYTPDDLVGLIQVPPRVVGELDKLVTWPNSEPGVTKDQMVDPADYLRPFYGSVPQGVRETYVGYVGWFEADPWALNPIAPEDAAQRMAQLVGGKTTLNDAAQGALDKGDYQWASELATLSLRANRADTTAKRIKLQAYTALGDRSVNPNWSNWYYTSANELASTQPCFVPYLAAGLVSSVIQAAVPLEAWVKSWTVRLDGQKAAAENGSKVLGFWFVPTNQDFGPQGYTITLRHGIAEVQQWSGTKAGFLATTSVAVELSEETLDGIITAPATSPATPGNNVSTALTAAIAAGKVKLLEGTSADVTTFFDFFEVFPACEPALSVPPSVPKGPAPK